MHAASTIHREVTDVVRDGQDYDVGIVPITQSNEKVAGQAARTADEP
jgi:hypothetical protein